MVNCHDMKKGEVYLCKECGVELEVVAECKDVGKPADDCGCHPSATPCTFSCCGKSLEKKA